MGEGREAQAIPIGPKSMQNSVFLALLRLIFALKTKIAPLKSSWDENLR